MLKIYKCFKPKIFPRAGSVRFFTSKDCPIFDCKRSNEEEELIEESIRKFKESRIPKVFRLHCNSDFKTYKNIFFFICIPCVLAMYVNITFFEEEQHKRLKFVPYTHLRIRNEPSIWKPRTLFHNPEYNALPNGYEVEFPEEDEIHPLDLKSDEHYR